MIWVKTCGLRTEADVAAAVDAGADAIGLVLAPDSPRRVTVDRARELARDLPVLTVIVTVDFTAAELLAAADSIGAGGVQPHGKHRREAAAAAGAEGLFVLHPLAVRGEVDLSGVPDGQTPLLDSFRPGAHGGTGRSFDWDLLRGVERAYVLAGGLGPGNVAQAVQRVAPWGVDASSGLESSPGVKDPELIRDFIEIARGR